MKIITALFICFIAFIDMPSQYKWQLQKEKNNIRVYSRSVENTDIRELKAETTVEVPLSNIVAMIKDVNYYPNWVYRCSEARILKKVSETEFYYYQLTYAPWPISNRDMIIRCRISQDQQTGRVIAKLDGAPDFIEEKPGIVRVQKFSGEWVLTPVDDGKVRIVHELFIKPQGDIPSWLMNYAAVEGPYSTIHNMIQKLNDKRFANRTFGFLKDRI